MKKLLVTLLAGAMLFSLRPAATMELAVASYPRHNLAAMARRSPRISSST